MSGFDNCIRPLAFMRVSSSSELTQDILNFIGANRSSTASATSSTTARMVEVGHPPAGTSVKVNAPLVGEGMYCVCQKRLNPISGYGKRDAGAQYVEDSVVWVAVSGESCRS